LADKATPTAFLSVHFLLAVQKKVNMRFYFLSGRSERKCESLLFPKKSWEKDFSNVYRGTTSFDRLRTKSASVTK